MGTTLDAGALLAADRGERRMWARHRALPAAKSPPRPLQSSRSPEGGAARRGSHAYWSPSTSKHSTIAKHARSARSRLAARGAVKDIVDQQQAERAPSADYREQQAERAPFREIAWLLIKYRMDTGLSQQQLADLVGTSHSQISRIESGRHRTNLETLQRIATALNRTLVVGFESTDTRGRPKRDLVAL